MNIVKPIAAIGTLCRRDSAPHHLHPLPAPISAHDIEQELENASSPDRQLPMQLSLGKSVSESGHGHRDSLWNRELGIKSVEEISSRSGAGLSARHEI